MKTLIKELIFDKDIINRLREEKIHEPLLYNLLNTGKITLHEYLKCINTNKNLNLFDY